MQSWGEQGGLGGWGGGRGVPWEIRESRLSLYPTTPTQNVNSKIHLRYVDFFENPLQDKHVLSISFKSMKTSRIVFISMCTTFTKLNTLYLLYYYNFSSIYHFKEWMELYLVAFAASQEIFEKEENLQIQISSTKLPLWSKRNSLGRGQRSKNT